MRDSILLVEDDALLRAALAQRLHAGGHQVFEASCASDAWEPADRCRLAVLDLGLPPTPDLPDEGLRLLQTLAQTRPAMPVIVMTGQDEAHVAHRAIGCGAFDFLPKPVEPAAFDLALQRALRFVRAHEQLAARGQTPLQLSAIDTSQGLRNAIDSAQEKLIRLVLQQCQHNVAEAARRLGIQRTQLYYYLDKFGIQREPPKDAP